MYCSKLIKKLSQEITTNQVLTLFYDNGLVFKSNKNTGIFESTNSLEEDDPNFKEFYDCAFEISEILNFPRLNENSEINEGDYLTISEHMEPQKIENVDGTIIWKKE